jgi:hypothetical protein
MKHIKTYKGWNDVNEGWKENLIAALTLASSVAFGSSKIETDFNKGYSSELVIEDKDKDFYSACFQACQEMKSGDLNIEQSAALLEAQMYFQSKRDNEKVVKLSDEGKIATKIVMEKVMSLPKDEIQRLIDSGSNGKVSGHIVGL